MNEAEAIKRRFELVTGELHERTRRLVAARNQAGDGLSLSQAVEAYRDEYVVECNFGRVIGHPL